MLTTPEGGVVIEGFEFEGLHGRKARTRLTIYGKVVVATEQDDNPGASITNAAEHLWPKVRALYGDDIIAIEHYAAGRYGSRTLTDPGLEEEWALVTIINGSIVNWDHLKREAVLDLIRANGGAPDV